MMGGFTLRMRGDKDMILYMGKLEGFLLVVQ